MYLVILICVRAPVQPPDVIGKLMGGSACEILTIPRKAGIRYLPAVWRATSVQNLYRPARRQKQRHLELVRKKMAVITTDKLNIRE